MLTAGGEIEITRRYFWAAGRGVYPVETAAGIADSHVTPGAREICCRMAMVQDFAQAVEDARRIGGFPLSKERLRQVVEGEAATITDMRNQSECRPRGRRRRRRSRHKARIAAMRTWMA